jgi:hypothetical protein
VAAAIALPALLGACGSSTSRNATAPTTASVSRAADSTANTADATDATASATSGAANASLCTGLQGLDPSKLEDSTGELDPSAMASALQDAASHAPSEIKSDIQTVAAVELPILQGKEAPDDSKFDDPKLLGALAHISQYLAQHCASTGS